MAYFDVSKIYLT